MPATHLKGLSQRNRYNINGLFILERQFAATRQRKAMAPES